LQQQSPGTCLIPSVVAPLRQVNSGEMSK
jgi:hypothetical protein